MQIGDVPRVTTFFMFQGQAEEAVRFYTSLFDDGEVLELNYFGSEEPGTEGSDLLAKFRLGGQTFLALNSSAVHEFTFTPSISLFVTCDSEEEIDHLAASLAEGGMELMPLGNYGFSTKFTWVNDRYGVSWQLNLP
jgi:predicted 3-demethylubiquinone-9 3-methyltransferase (glyoxalase superfamily)